jgi:putative methanogenesis marker protein 6
MVAETRVILISPDSEITPQQLKSRLLTLLSETGASIKVKETCFGALVEGEPQQLRALVEEARKLDPQGIYSKPRGFPIGDARICRATRKGGPRPGFHQLEQEYQLLPRVRDALKRLEERKTG